MERVVWRFFNYVRFVKVEWSCYRWFLVIWNIRSLVGIS